MGAGLPASASPHTNLPSCPHSSCLGVTLSLPETSQQPLYGSLTPRLGPRAPPYNCVHPGWPSTCQHLRSLPAPRAASCPQRLYLSEGALEGAKSVEAPGRNADHGGESQEPAQGIAPPRVRVFLVVGQRSVLDQGEEEGGLGGNGRERGWGRGPVPSAPPPPAAWKKSPSKPGFPPGSSGPISLQSSPSTLCPKPTPPSSRLCHARAPVPLGTSTCS